MNIQNSPSMIAFFPGQGSQHVGMGKDLHDNFKVAKNVFEEASDATHLDIKKLCFDGPESDLKLTENTQPCLLTVSVAAFRVAQTEIGFKPALAAGHSLGEYSALVAAEALSLATAAQWVRERGAAMQKAVPAGQGTMAAILSLEDSDVEILCQKATANAQEKRAANKNHGFTVEAVAQPANFNAPGQLVIAGSMDAIEEAISLVKSGGTNDEFARGKAILLEVSAPFHCKLMEPARARMAEIFSKAKDNEKPLHLTCPYIPNRTARITTEPGIILEMLIDQIDHPVLWKQSVQTMLDNGYTSAVEFGPGKVIQGLVKRIGQKLSKNMTVTGLGTTTDLKRLNDLTTTQQQA